ncbi:MAG: GspE/PulE family protein [Patescibacteria group bacterium]
MSHFNEADDDKKFSDLRKKEEEEFLQIMSEKYSIPYLDIASVSVDVGAVGLLKEDVARAALIAPFQLSGKNLRVAIFSPTDASTKEVISSLEERGFKIELYLSSHASLEKVWERYHDISGATKSTAGLVDISGESIEGLALQFKTLSDVQVVLKELLDTKDARNVTKILNVILSGAIGVGASDIHVEPSGDSVHLRIRIDGVLQEVGVLPTSIYHLFSSRLKLLAGLKLNLGAESQDGRFSIRISNLDVEIRVSVIPSAYGEGIVMRILNPKSLDVTLEDLGMNPRLYALIEKEIRRPHGMILNTGPTGSGKTTTLYAFLKKVFSPEIKMMTIEDPIEYHLAGVSQTQVEETKGYTFLEGIRAAMRQDPDIIMVGEIRDSETAKVAINAALTGHMVFSTLHTNTAAGAIPRLIELGVTPKIIGSSVTVIIAQRLARKLCDFCKKEDTPSSLEKKIIDEVALSIEHKTGTKIQSQKIWRPIGCEKCNNTGYRGRVGIFEVVLMDADIEALLDGVPSEREVREAAKKQKMLNLREDGIEKITSGITSFDEVARVVDLDRE